MNQYERIAEINAELTYLKNHEYLLQDYQEELEVLLDKKNELENQLQKENEDVERLEETTVSSLFYQLVGKKEERLQKERQEVMQASLNYHQALREYEYVLNAFQNLKERFDRKQELLNELESLRLETSSLTQQEKLELKESKELYFKQQAVLKELQEAIDAGEAVYRSLTEAEDYLDLAQSYGYFDIGGGGFFTSMVKHNQIDRVQKAMVDVKMQILKFEKELQDVCLQEIGVTQLDELDVACDIYLDNIFMDIKVQSQINKTLADIKGVIISVQEVVDRLNDEKEKTLQQQVQLQSQIEKMIQGII